MEVCRAGFLNFHFIYHSQSLNQFREDCRGAIVCQCTSMLVIESAPSDCDWGQSRYWSPDPYLEIKI